MYFGGIRYFCFFVVNIGIYLNVIVFVVEILFSLNINCIGYFFNVIDRRVVIKVRIGRVNVIFIYNICS